MIRKQLVNRWLAVRLLSAALSLVAVGPAQKVMAQTVKTVPQQQPPATAKPSGNAVLQSPATVKPPGGIGVPITPQYSIAWCVMDFRPMPQPPACMPILETVFVSPFGATPGRVTSVSWGGLVPIQPADTVTFRVRAPSPTQMVVLANGQPLPQIAPGAPPPSPDDSGYYSVFVQPLPGPATAWQFWSIVMKLPKPFRFVAQNINVPPLTVTLRDISLGPFTGSQKQAPDLNIPLAGWPPAFPPGAPSAEFLRGENSKDDTDIPAIDLGAVGKIHISGPMPRARLGIVAQSVTLAGWLTGCGDLGGGQQATAQNPCPAPFGSSEDYHFSMELDNDFIQRNYPPDALPLRGAVLPGQPVRQACWLWHNAFGGDYACPCGAGPLGDLPGCVQRLPLAIGPVPDVPSLLMPGERFFCCELNVELNAWHPSARGAAPAGYAPDVADASNWWAFEPIHGTHFPTNAPQHVLTGGDYVIVTGTLWQDACHGCSANAGPPPEPPDPVDVCWDRARPADAGWLEIHPPDVVRFVSPQPSLRRRAFVVAACAEQGKAAVYPPLPGTDVHCDPAPRNQPSACSGMLQPGPPPDANAVLKFQEFPDPRFTDPNPANIAKTVSLGCGPDGTMSVLDVSAQDLNPTGMSTFKSTFLLWWEESPTPRPLCPRLTSIVGSVSGRPPALTATLTITDALTKQPVPGMSVWVQDLFGRSQSSGTTAADGTVRLAYAPCPVSIGLSPAPGVPSPACPIYGVLQGYNMVNYFTPVLAATGTVKTQNSLSVSVSDPMTKANVAGATVSVVYSSGQTLTSGTTGADGTVSLSLSGICTGSGPYSACNPTVVVSKAGYPSCSFPVPSGGSAFAPPQAATCQ
jgi:hypothetical protein